MSSNGSTVKDEEMDVGEQKMDVSTSSNAAASSSSAASSTAAASSGPGVATADIPPNQTLYVNNINEKIKMDELKKSLYLIFSSYGNILEINCSSTYYMRGQAWIIYDQLNSATKAHRELQNFLFYGKPLRITFAKVKSDTVAKLDGSLNNPASTRGKRKAREVDTRPKKGAPVPQQQKKKQKVDAKAAPVAAAAAASSSAPVPPSAASSMNDGPAPPHRILFLEQLPAVANDAMIAMLFQHPGFKEARVIPGKAVAFVEYEDEYQATTAMQVLQGFKITPTNAMKITYAKK